MVIEELGAGDRSAAELRLQAVADVPILAVGPEAETLARALLFDGAVPSNSPRDALHIAIAAAHGTDYLLTWNFRHINNAETRRHVVRVVADHGLVCPVPCSPEELGGRFDDERSDR